MRTIVVHRACVVILLAGLSTRTAPAGERYIAYGVPFGSLGNQDAPGALGKDFDVNVSIEVVRLGVFDSGSDGLALPITARLYDRDTGIEQASLAFTPDDPGELVGGSRFKDLEAPLELPPGFHGCIIAEGYGAAEMNGISPRYSLFQRRTANGATTVVETSSERPIPPDAWMRIARAGDDVIASFSADGAAWTELGRVAFALPETIHIGIAATSRDPSGSRNGLEATFCDVALDAGGGGPAFRRGDANDDGSLNITDGIFTLNFLFLGGATPPCMDAADSNDDAAVNITDGIFVLNFLFLGGPEPPAPGPTDCGTDETEDENTECASASCP